MSDEKKCECPETGQVPSYMEHWYSEAEKPGMYHQPNECKCTNDLAMYDRAGKLLCLCSCCWLPGDKRLPST